MLTFLIYLASVLNNINTIIGLYVVIFIILLIILFIATIAARDDEEDLVGVLKYFKYIQKKIFIILLPIFLGLLIPDEKTMYIMLGAYSLDKKDIPNKVETIISGKLDEIIKDMQDKIKSKDK